MSRNPFVVLGLPRHADDEAVRKAYLAAVAKHPPDRDSQAFRRIREAYEALRDRRSRARFRLFGMEGTTCLEDVLDTDTGPPRYVGPEPWLAVLRQATPPRESG